MAQLKFKRGLVGMGWTTWTSWTGWTSRDRRWQWNGAFTQIPPLLPTPGLCVIPNPPQIFPMDVPKVLVADPVSDRGVAELRGGGELDVTVKTGLKEDQLLE